MKLSHCTLRHLRIYTFVILNQYVVTNQNIVTAALFIFGSHSFQMRINSAGRSCYTTLPWRQLLLPFLLILNNTQNLLTSDLFTNGSSLEFLIILNFECLKARGSSLKVTLQWWAVIFLCRSLFLTIHTSQSSFTFFPNS